MTGAAKNNDVEAIFIHGAAVRFAGKGVLLLGPPASGKSDLALRLIDAGAMLIADDQVRIEARRDRLHAGPHDRLKGLINLRGIGILRLPFEEGPLDLAVDLVSSEAMSDPLPPPATASWLGVDLPKIGLDPKAASAVARIRMLLAAERVY
jgi:serine kinase of HPr protein (carbohydrate metabolism regulator)